MSALEHGPECPCPRCTGFQRGHTLSTRHGAYAALQLGPRAREIADSLRSVVPGYSPSDDPSIESYAIVKARLERAEAAFAALDEAADQQDAPLSPYLTDRFDRLRRDMQGWLNVARRYEEALGLTPGTRARLGIDVARMQMLDLALLSEATLVELQAAYERAEAGS